MGHHGSGEIFLAFSTAGARGLATFPDAERTTGREGRVGEALPHDEVLSLLAEHGRLARTRFRG